MGQFNFGNREEDLVGEAGGEKVWTYSISRAIVIQIISPHPPAPGIYFYQP
jgi:hypothetical protein